MDPPRAPLKKIYTPAEKKNIFFPKQILNFFFEIIFISIKDNDCKKLEVKILKIGRVIGLLRFLKKYMFHNS